MAATLFFFDADCVLYGPPLAEPQDTCRRSAAFQTNDALLIGQAPPAPTFTLHLTDRPVIGFGTAIVLHDSFDGGAVIEFILATT